MEEETSVAAGVARARESFESRALHRGEQYEVVEGKAPEVTVTGARSLLNSIDTETVPLEGF